MRPLKLPVKSRGIRSVSENVQALDNSMKSLRLRISQGKDVGFRSARERLWILAQSGKRLGFQT